MAASTLGVEAGWQPLPEGGHEYTIQIEPSLVRLLESGNDVVSEVPSQIDVRRFRIKLGTGELSRIDGPPRAAADDSLAAPAMPPTDAATHTPAEDDLAAPWPGAQPAEEPAGRSPTATAPADESFALPAAEIPPGDDALDLPAPETSPSAAKGEPAVPARFEQPAADAQPLDGQGATTGAVPRNHDTQRPSLDSGAGEPQRPWLPLLLVVVFLACSLGANFYLGWMFWDARQRLRGALARVRPAT
ncbi:MAG: hypothetical protein WD845_15645 [Pirellulales bacterium]